MTQRFVWLLISSFLIFNCQTDHSFKLPAENHPSVSPLFHSISISFLANIVNPSGAVKFGFE